MRVEVLVVDKGRDWKDEIKLNILKLMEDYHYGNAKTSLKILYIHR